MEPPRPVPRAADGCEAACRRERPARRPERPDGPLAGPAVPGFRLLVDPAPGHRQQAPAEVGEAEVVSAGSSSDGAHVARVKTDAGGRGELLVSVLVDRGRVDVRVQAADPAAAAWVQERAWRIREALAEAGLDLARLDLRSPRDGRRDGGRHRGGGGRG